ncbi:hypothetical protein ACFFUE_03250 [Bergeyella porcorum]
MRNIFSAASFNIKTQLGFTKKEASFHIKGSFVLGKKKLRFA